MLQIPTHTHTLYFVSLYLHLYPYFFNQENYTAIKDICLIIAKNKESPNVKISCGNVFVVLSLISMAHKLKHVRY